MTMLRDYNIMLFTQEPTSSDLFWEEMM